MARRQARAKKRVKNMWRAQERVRLESKMREREKKRQLKRGGTVAFPVPTKKASSKKVKWGEDEVIPSEGSK